MPRTTPETIITFNFFSLLINKLRMTIKTGIRVQIREASPLGINLTDQVTKLFPIPIIKAPEIKLGMRLCHDHWNLTLVKDRRTSNMIPANVLLTPAKIKTGKLLTPILMNR
jgi:hypothetical protein